MSGQETSAGPAARQVWLQPEDNAAGISERRLGSGKYDFPPKKVETEILLGVLWVELCPLTPKEDMLGSYSPGSQNVPCLKYDHCTRN